MAPDRLPERTSQDAALVGIAVVVGSLVGASIAAAVLEGIAGIADASPVYLVPVVLVAALFGTWPAIGTSVLSFLVYDFLFTVPRFTLAVTDPAEWLSLLLFLLIAVVIGRLAALLRERAEVADRRSRESVSLATISRAVAMGTSFEEAAAAVVGRLRVDAEMETVSIERATADGDRVTVARAGGPTDGADDASADAPPWTLIASAADGSSDWVRIVGLGETAAIPTSDVRDVYLVPIEADGARLGAIRATRLTGEPRPGRGARRILLATADQLGTAIRRDDLRDELTAGEVARQGDVLRTAILDSVSHDLRTPLATIRALAGGLLDAVAPSTGDVRAAAAAIDGQAERLGELVRDLLDMSRIQAGALHPDVEAYELAELVETAVREVGPDQATRRISVAVSHELPPVAVDAVLFDAALQNVLDNALRHAPAPAPVVVRANVAEVGTVVLSVDDGGPGVPPEALPFLFDRFYRVPNDAEPARHGIGMGLAIARGFIEAMDGSIEAGPSELGGLRVAIGLHAIERPPEETEVAPGPGVGEVAAADQPG